MWHSAILSAFGHTEDGRFAFGWPKWAVRAPFMLLKLSTIDPYPKKVGYGPIWIFVIYQWTDLGPIHRADDPLCVNWWALPAKRVG